MIVATTNDITGHRVVRYLGVVRGITVRSRSIVGNVGASVQALLGGNIIVTGPCAEGVAKAANRLPPKVMCKRRPRAGQRERP